MRSVMVGMVAVFLSVSAGALDSQPASDSATPQAAPEGAIVPGERIGPLHLAGRIEDFVRLLGPGKVRNADPFLVQIWDGIWVQFDPATGNVVWISMDTSAPSAWARYTTAHKIGLGTRRESVLSTMGEPARIVTAGGATSLYYDRSGIRFTLFDSGARAGTVGAVRIVWPSVARGDELIVPGVRISGLEIMQALDEALARLGPGYAKGGTEGKGYYWRHLDLCFMERGGRVAQIRTGCGEPIVQLLRYGTADGLGRGSSASQIKAVLGEPEENSGRMWIYPRRGIAFLLDAEENTLAVDVFAPQTRN